MLGNLIERKKLIHRDWNQDEVEKVVQDMLNIYENQVAPFIRSMKEFEMTPEQQNEFARLALAKRLDDCPTYLEGEHAKLLTSYRSEDDGNSLWKVLQRVQENLGLNYRGNPVEISYSYKSKDKEGNEETKTRTVQQTVSIKKVSELNGWLFDAAREFMKQS